MKYVKLVPDAVCKTPISVKLHGEGLTERGEPITVFEADLMCNYQDGAKTVMTQQKKLVEISGRALFNGDIAPDMPVISGGEVKVFGVNRHVLRGLKARNPDGTVNYTCLELI
jgi:hypothetical protein